MPIDPEILPTFLTEAGGYLKVLRQGLAVSEEEQPRTAVGTLQQAAHGLKGAIKVEVIKRRDLRFEEIPVMYSSRLGEIKLNPWRDGFQNLAFLFKKRLQF